MSSLLGLKKDGRRTILAKKIQLETNHGMLDLLFILILLASFAISALIIVMIGARVYQNVTVEMQSNFDLRIPLSYISTKVKQHDAKGAVQLMTKEGTEVLVLTSLENQTSYETWVYAYHNQLYEVMIKKGEQVAIADGMAILPLQGLDLKMDSNKLLQVTSYNKAGKKLDLFLNIRSD